MSNMEYNLRLAACAVVVFITGAIAGAYAVCIAVANEWGKFY